MWTVACEQLNLHCLVTLALQAGLQVIPEVLSYGIDIACWCYLQLMINYKWKYVELLTEFCQFHESYESCLRWWWITCNVVHSVVHSDILKRVGSYVKDSAWVSQQEHILGNSFKIILIIDFNIKHKILSNTSKTQLLVCLPERLLFLINWMSEAQEKSTGDPTILLNSLLQSLRLQNSTTIQLHSTFFASSFFFEKIASNCSSDFRERLTVLSNINYASSTNSAFLTCAPFPWPLNDIRRSIGTIHRYPELLSV